jgi:hypothetical protein
VRNARLCLGAILLMALANAAAWAGPCEPTIEKSSSAGNYGYAERDGGRRCEGIYISPTGGADVEIASITLGPLEYKLDQPVTLSVRLAATNPITLPVHLRAVHIPGSIFYQMDADVVTGTELRWPLNDVIQPEGIASKDLGLYAYAIARDGTKTFIPVSASPEGTSVAPAQVVAVVLRVKNLARARWRFVANSAKAGPYQTIAPDDDRVVISLPPDHREPGALEFRWDEATTGISHVRLFMIGG